MSDTSNGVNSLDTLFLKYACHPMFSKMLNEIINAKPRNLVRAMSERDIYVLANYLQFTANKYGDINIKAARKEIERFLINYPFFQRENSNTTNSFLL